MCYIMNLQGFWHGKRIIHVVLFYKVVLYFCSSSFLAFCLENFGRFESLVFVPFSIRCLPNCISKFKYRPYTPTFITAHHWNSEIFPQKKEGNWNDNKTSKKYHKNEHWQNVCPIGRMFEENTKNAWWKMACNSVLTL